MSCSITALQINMRVRSRRVRQYGGACSYRNHTEYSAALQHAFGRFGRGSPWWNFGLSIANGTRGPAGPPLSNAGNRFFVAPPLPPNESRRSRRGSSGSSGKLSGPSWWIFGEPPTILDRLRDRLREDDYKAPQQVWQCVSTIDASNMRRRCKRRTTSAGTRSFSPHAETKSVPPHASAAALLLYNGDVEGSVPHLCPTAVGIR